MESHTFYCDKCSAIVHVVATNRSARTTAFCYGQDDVDPLTGSHPETRMRMIGTKPLRKDQI